MTSESSKNQNFIRKHPSEGMDALEKESISNITKSIDKSSFSSISYKPNDHKLTKKILISSVKYFLRCFYLKF